MNQRSYSPATVAAYVVGILGTFLIMVFLVWIMRSYTRPAPLGSARADERRKMLAEVNAADAEALNHYGWVDQPHGIVRLPITVAMELTIKEWRNPAAARSNLVARAELQAKTGPPAAGQGSPAQPAGTQPSKGQPGTGQAQPQAQTQGTPGQSTGAGKTNDPASRTPAPPTPPAGK